MIKKNHKKAFRKHQSRPCTANNDMLFGCLLYTSDAADEEDSVDLGGRRINKKKKKEEYRGTVHASLTEIPIF